MWHFLSAPTRWQRGPTTTVTPTSSRHCHQEVRALHGAATAFLRGTLRASRPHVPALLPPAAYRKPTALEAAVLCIV